jgi:hypothetical protein
MIEEHYKSYTGISRDHSASMKHLTKYAAIDYNNQIQEIKANAEGIDTIVSVVKCGVGRQGIVERIITNSNVNVLKEITTSDYDADGWSTPLFDSIGTLIELFEAAPDANEDTVAFLVMAITDGEENSSVKWKHTLFQKIQQLQATDKWTFVFRVPKGYAKSLTKFGIHPGNILEWDQTEAGFVKATQETSTALSGYYNNLRSGVRSTDRFFTNIADVSPDEIKKKLHDITNQVSFWVVSDSEAGVQIRDFCESHLHGQKMLKGAGFYQLVKPEKDIQDYKQIIIRDKSSGLVYTGDAVRDMLGLPNYGHIKVSPGDHGQWDIYIQSTSVNRKLPAETSVLYYANIGKPYHEGKSA